MDRLISRRSVRLVLVLMGLLVLTRLFAMAWMPLMDTTEARYGEIGRKMAELGDWVTPWADNGVPFWGKPPLSFWLTAASFKLIGVHEFAARLPHLLCSLLIGAMVWRLARPYSRSEALAASAVLTGSVLFFVASAAVMTDSALVLGTTMAMSGFWLALHDPSPVVRRRQSWLFFLGIALGLLAKGPVAVVLIATPLLAWIAWSPRRSVAWYRLPWVRGLLLVAAFTLPWYGFAEQRTPGFLQYFFVGEHWHRFVIPGWTGDLYGSAHRYPPGTIWVFAFAALLPWSVWVPFAAWWWHRKALPTTPSPVNPLWRRYLLLWALTPLLFFTPARNILWTYVLPAAPPFSLLVAEWLMRKAPTVKAPVWLATGLAATLVAATGGMVVNTRSQHFERKSTAALVQAYEQHRESTQALAFVGQRPASAMFYTRGKAVLARDSDALLQYFGSSGGFFAVPARGAMPLGRASTAALVGHFGEFDLRHLPPTEPTDMRPPR